MKLDKYLQLLKIFLILPVLTLALTGCKKDEDENSSPRSYYYDPQIPFGNINLNQTKVQNVQNLQADASIVKKIKLTWKIPPLYRTLPHKVFIYKRKSPPSGFNLVCPKPAADFFSLCPADEASGAPLYLYQELVAEQFLDQNSIDENGDETNNVEIDADYTYWVFMQINGAEWSSGVRINVKSKETTTNFELPTASEFWIKKRWSMGLNPINGTQNYLQSMDAGPASPGNPRGGIALAFSGNILYYADTKNNRVLIYARDGALSCEQFTDEFEKSACLLQFIGAPLTVINVLGQPSGGDTFACGQTGALPANECLTAPRRVSVVGNKLFISDSGNNRIVVYDQLPRNGCVSDNGSGIATPRNCTPNWVIGKRGLMDLSNYTVAAAGKSILKTPTDVVAKDEALFIADTGNNRIIRIDNYADRFDFNCTPDTWGGPLCEFDGVLGQEDFFTDHSFSSLVAADPNIILQTGIKDTLHPDSENLLKRYFREPVRIMFTPDDKLMVVANERFSQPNAIGGVSALHARILIFNTNPIENSLTTCNPGTFNIGECDADAVIGQAQFNKLETASSASVESYSQSYRMFSLDDADLLNLPANDASSEDKQLLLGVNSVTNEVYIWNNWPKNGPDPGDGSSNGTAGFPRDFRAVDPQGAPNPATGILQPDLQSLCAIRMSIDSGNIYITDCGGYRVHEIQAVDYTND